jgi:hypothetical protein
MFTGIVDRGVANDELDQYCGDQQHLKRFAVLRWTALDHTLGCIFFLRNLGRTQVPPTATKAAL